MSSIILGSFVSPRICFQLVLPLGKRGSGGETSPHTPSLAELDLASSALTIIEQKYKNLCFPVLLPALAAEGTTPLSFHSRKITQSSETRTIPRGWRGMWSQPDLLTPPAPARSQPGPPVSFSTAIKAEKNPAEVVLKVCQWSHRGFPPTPHRDLCGLQGFPQNKLAEATE